MKRVLHWRLRRCRISGRHGGSRDWWYSPPSGPFGGTARHLTKRECNGKLELLERKHAVEKERSASRRTCTMNWGAPDGKSCSSATRAEMKNNGDGEKIGTSLGQDSTLARSVVGNLDSLVWTWNRGTIRWTSWRRYISEYRRASRDRRDSMSVRRSTDLAAFPRCFGSAAQCIANGKEALNNAVKHFHCSEFCFGCK